MKAAIIGASEESLHTIEKAHNLGVTVVALDGNKDAAGLKAADSGIVVDISDEKTTIAVLENERPDCILTVPIGRYLTTIGAVNEALQLPGIDRQMAAGCTDKYLFHQRLAKRQLRECRCYLLTPEELPLWIEEKAMKLPLSYPAIMKPRYGSGSRGIYFLNNVRELRQTLSELQKAYEAGEKQEDFVVEEAAPGTEYGVDAVVTKNCFHMILLRRKINTPPPARQAVGYFSVVPEEETLLYEKVARHMERVVQALGLQECLFHADLMIENSIFVIELSARPSGHNLHNLFTPLATGIDMAEQFIRYRLGKSYSFTPQRVHKMLIHYFDLVGTIKKVPTTEEVRTLLKEEITSQSEVDVSLIEWNCNLKPGDILEPVTNGHSLMGRGFFILEGVWEQQLLSSAAHIQSILTQ